MRRNRNRFPTAPTVGQPLQVLVQELARLQHVSTMKLEKGPMRIQVTYA